MTNIQERRLSIVDGLVDLTEQDVVIAVLIPGFEPWGTPLKMKKMKIFHGKRNLFQRNTNK